MGTVMGYVAVFIFGGLVGFATAALLHVSD